MEHITRRQIITALASTAILPSLPGCALRETTSNAEDQVKALLDSIAYNLLQLEAETATSLGLDKDSHIDLRSQLNDRSLAGIRTGTQLLRDDLARLIAVDTSTLSMQTRTSVEVVKSAYRLALEGYALPYGDVAVGSYRNSPYLVSQNTGAYLDIPDFLDTDHIITGVADAKSWIARLSQYPKVLDDELQRMQAAYATGLIPPRFLIEKTLIQLEQSAKDARDGGLLVTSITDKTKNIPGDWNKQAYRIMTQEVAPALQRQIAEFKHQLPAATDDPGMYSRPHGNEYYRWALKAATTTNMSADEIHQLGVAQLKSLHDRMEPILQNLGYKQGSVGERMKALANDPRYQFADGDPGRAEILAFIRERIAILRAQMPRAFNTLVRGNVEVKRLLPAQELGSPAAFGGSGSIDGSIPGKLWINLRTTHLHSRYSLPDLVHHEAIPGHVWQGEYSRKLPLIRTMLDFNAYTEGWALYAEQLADELGVYDDFPVGRLGYLQSIAFRACRLIVDTGLHARGWTREQAVRFFIDTNGSNPLEVASEVDRYCSWPGQACGYEVGHQEINRQRARAQLALGSRYDLKAFNDTVVLGGNVPLDVLALNVDEYIRTASV